MGSYSRKNDYGSRVGASIITFLIAFIPTWFWIGIYTLAAPDGFWQKFAVLGIGAVMAGSVQLVFFIIWIAVMINAIWD